MIIQNFGVKFPFMHRNTDRQFIDLNESMVDKVTSQILHVIMTPKGERLRMPDFGTDLIRYVYEPNTELTWEKIVKEASDSIGKYVKDVKIISMDIYKDEEDDNTSLLEIVYGVNIGNKFINNRIITKI